MPDDTEPSAQPTDDGDLSGAGPRGNLLRDVALPALLALAIMLAVWWLWRVTVVDVGTRATAAPPSSTGRREG